LKEGVTIFVSTAYLDEAERCHRIGLIHQGNLLSVGSPEEIRGLMKEELWEIRCSERRKAQELLRSAEGVRRAGVFGDKIHAAFENGEKTKEVTERLLRESGLEKISVRRITPSLEDIFITTIKKQIRNPKS